MHQVVVLLALLAACDFRPAPKLVVRDAGVVGDASIDARAAPLARIASDASVAPAIIADAEIDAAPAADAATDAAADPAIDAMADAELDADMGTVPTADCVTTAQQIATVVIDGVDPGVRGQYEHARANIVRRTAAACTAEAWSAEKQQCFRLAKLDADIRACEAMYPKAQ